jgi:hypothetical protein
LEVKCVDKVVQYWSHKENILENVIKIEKWGIVVFELLELPGVETVAITGIEADLKKT